MAIWLHPSVTSTIVDNSGFYATADGVTTLFAPGFFQKGKDNELIAVDGPSDADLVKKFGSIDAVEYGQNHLNLVNWLTAGGSAVVMRCLPDNAKYAHAILEVLTKKSTVKGLTVKINEGTVAIPDYVDYELDRDYDVDGNFIGLVYINKDDEKVLVCSAENTDKVTGVEALEAGESIKDFLLVGESISESNRTAVNVIPKITYVPSGVSKKETIEAYIRNKNASYDSKGNLINPDSNGYARHILGYFIPEGRGAIFYNDIRISITLASNYDNTYDFRVYALTFEKYDAENDEWGVIYGPFYVSFDETSRDFSNETMFIADILEKYCEEITFVPFGANAEEESGEYNKGFYDAAKDIAGSDANPRRVDILSCQEYFSEAEETFSHLHRNTFVNGGSLTLRKDILINSNKLYVEGALPIVGATLIIADSVYRTVESVNTTTGEITVSEAFTKKAYKDAEIDLMETDAEKDYAKTVSVIAAEHGIVYVNDIPEPTSIASIKPMDNAIARITSKKYKLFLNKNGADFKIGDNVTIEMNPLQIWTPGQSVVDNPATVPTIKITSVSEGSPLEDEIVPNQEFTFDSNTNTYIRGNIKFIHIAADTDNNISAHWELVKTVDNNSTVIASSDDDGENPAAVTFTDFTCIYNHNNEMISSLSFNDSISFNAIISDLDSIDDAIIIDFTKATNTNAAKDLISKFDTFDFTEDPSAETSDNASGGSYDNLITITAEETPVSPFAKPLSLSEGDYAYMLYGSAGDADTADGASRATVATTRKNLLIKAFRGTLNPAITMKKFWPIDIVLDANYDVSVKNAINELTLSREDFMFLCDTGFCATPEQAIEKRNGSLVYNNRYTAIFTQDMRVYDEYSSKNIKVTPTYFLAKKIPYVDRAYGIHYAFVGPNRGEVEGMVEGTLSWNPTEAQKEKLYKKQLNYIQHDPNHLMFMGQLTSQKRSTSLSDIPNVRALLMIRRNIEAICEEYYFERINENLLAVMSNACNTYLGQWVANGTLSNGNVSVYASEYDMKQKLVRVQVELTFTSFLERVVITFTVK